MKLIFTTLLAILGIILIVLGLFLLGITYQKIIQPENVKDEDVKNEDPIIFALLACVAEMAILLMLRVASKNGGDIARNCLYFLFILFLIFFSGVLGAAIYYKLIEVPKIEKLKITFEKEKIKAVNEAINEASSFMLESAKKSIQEGQQEGR
ncbi:MAG: hypothetical protein AB1798_18025 [Spirochaetota bacterium]